MAYVLHHGSLVGFVTEDQLAAYGHSVDHAL